MSSKQQTSLIDNDENLKAKGSRVWLLIEICIFYLTCLPPPQKDVGIQHVFTHFLLRLLRFLNFSTGPGDPFYRGGSSSSSGVEA
ncbi:hypothetical protein H5410_024365 [Solanum commersonii]|uniref:Uncharacterized protein n=1 Tax=Solanum commersonii TaxID=4109 RepID=A0A9J5ZLT0_SOLCO|nr:hypothetical protein H5410_024365 [Solanum commersonii]